MRRHWCTGTILILGLVLGFVAGRTTTLFGEQCSSGSSHVDVILAYIRMHVWLRGPALQLSGRGRYRLETTGRHSEAF